MAVAAVSFSEAPRIWSGIQRAATLVGLVLVAMAAAGCLGDPSQEIEAVDEGSAWDGAMEIPWGLESCRASWVLAPANSDALQKYLPLGFEPAKTPQIPGGEEVAGLDTYLGFDAFQCESGTGLNGTIPALEFGSLFTRVTPPDEYKVEGLDGQYFFRWEVLIPDQPRFGHLKELGLAVRMGDAHIEPLSSAGSPGPWRTTLDLTGLGTFSFQGATMDPESPGDDVAYAAFTPATGDVATWQARATNLTAALGWGTWTVEPGSWVADALGAEQGVGVFSVGTWSITDAHLAIPGPDDAGSI